MENMNKQNNKSIFWKKLISGIFIGIGAILPGVSGGVLALAMGIYRDMINALNNFFKHMKLNFLFLLPIGIGGVIGVLSTSFTVEWLMNQWYVPAMFLFAGLVLGGAPTIYKSAVKNGLKPTNILWAVLGAAFVISLSLLDNGEAGMGTGREFTPFWAVVSGAIIAFGTIIPGVSASFILLLFNVYQPFLRAFNSFDIPSLFFAGLGLVVSGLVLIRIVKKIFDAYTSQAYFAVLGFLIGSVVIIFPQPQPNWWLALYIALFVGGFALSYFVSKVESQKKTQDRPTA